ncbi:MAG: hypothetical protein EOO68_02405 [Moraxellaceae bacterium]|nr:MAG: hypothetical protein EOO68_02405 [Moraxellaceae bacterium]
MESLPSTIILICLGGISATLIIASILLDHHILEPRPKRDVTIDSNLWPITLAENCFNETGKIIRKIALAIALCLIIIAASTLIYIGIILWLS